MSKETKAAILTQIYFLHPASEALIIRNALSIEIYSSQRAEDIGRVYAGFLADLPYFEEWAKENDESSGNDT